MTQNIEQLIEETIQSYYEYIVKVEGGCSVIAEAFQANDIATGVQGIQALSEGFSWVLEIESLLQQHSYHIDSPVGKIIPLFEKINAVLEFENYTTVGKLIGDELKPLFKKAKDWKFEEVVS